MLPLVAITVTVEVPTGVPGSPPPPLLPPPPPQPAGVIKNAHTIRASNRLRPLRPADANPNRKMPAKSAPALEVHPPEFPSFALRGAVVATVSMVEPLPATVGGLKL